MTTPKDEAEKLAREIVFKSEVSIPTHVRPILVREIAFKLEPLFACAKALETIREDCPDAVKAWITNSGYDATKAALATGALMLGREALATLKAKERNELKH